MSIRKVKAYAAALAMSHVLAATVVHAECPAADKLDTDLPSYIGKWVLAQGGCAAKDQGLSILSNEGKALLATAANALLPGLGAILGLGGDDQYAKWSQAILNEVDKQATITNNNIQAFWEWARATANSGIATDYATVSNSIAMWRNMRIEQQIQEITYFDVLVNDLSHVRHAMSMTVSPRDKIQWLHAYGMVVDLELAVIGERVRISQLNAQVARDPRYTGNMAAYAAMLSPAELNNLQALTSQETQEDWDLALISGQDTPFDYMSNIRAAFSAVTDDRVGPLVQCVGVTPPTWAYVVDHGNGTGVPACKNSSGAWLAPDCSVLYPAGQSSGRTCDTFDMVSPDSTHYYATYDATLMSKANVRNQHRWLTYGDMLVDGYGPLERKLDLWWHMVRTGYRSLTATDTDLLNYLDGQSPYASSITRYGSARGQPTALSNALTEAFQGCIGPTLNVVGVAVDTQIGLGYGLDKGTRALLDVTCSAFYEDPFESRTDPPYTLFADGMIANLDFHAYFKGQFGAKFIPLAFHGT